MNRRSLWELVKQTGKEFSADKASRLAAALAFYTVLSLAPLLLTVIGIAGLAFGDAAARGEIAQQLQDLIGGEGAKAVQDMLANSRSVGGGIVATAIGVVTLLVGATGVFAALQDALDTVWNVKPAADGGGIRAMVKDRLLSFTMICGMAFLVLVSLVLSAFLHALSEVFESWLPYSSVWLGLANTVVSFLVTGLMFAMIFKLLPHARPAWSDVWIGAGITALLFTLGKYLIGLYLGRASVSSTFGAAGSFVVLLMWVYYSSLILLFGAEFTQVYLALRYGTGLKSVSGLTPADTPNRTGAGSAQPTGSARVPPGPARRPGRHQPRRK